MIEIIVIILIFIAIGVWRIGSVERQEKKAEVKKLLKEANKKYIEEHPTEHKWTKGILIVILTISGLAIAWLFWYMATHWS